MSPQSSTSATFPRPRGGRWTHVRRAVLRPFADGAASVVVQRIATSVGINILPNQDRLWRHEADEMHNFYQ